MTLDLRLGYWDWSGSVGRWGPGVDLFDGGVGLLTVAGLRPGQKGDDFIRKMTLLDLADRGYK